jgi:hypothetical protein
MRILPINLCELDWGMWLSDLSQFFKNNWCKKAMSQMTSTFNKFGAGLTCGEVGKVLATLENIQANIDFWLRHHFGSEANAFRGWFVIDQPSREGTVSADDIGPLTDALLHCPHFAFHFDVHPRHPFDQGFDVYVEPAGPRC